MNNGKRQVIRFAALSLATCSMFAQQKTLEEPPESLKEFALLVSGSVFSYEGKRLGDLRLESSTKSPLGFALDGSSLCWPEWRDAFFEDLSSAGTVFLKRDGQSIRKIRMPGQFPTILSCSTRTSSILAVVAVRRGRVLGWYSESVTMDLTSLTTGLDLNSTRLVALSADGQIGLLSQAGEFRVISIRERRILLNTAGKFPSLRPDGRTVAFVEKSGSIVEVDVFTRHLRKRLTGQQVVGVGGWSSDQQTLLVAIRESDHARLIALREDGGFTRLMPLYDFLTATFIRRNLIADVLRAP